jgi:hypothetical protein
MPATSPSLYPTVSPLLVRLLRLLPLPFARGAAPNAVQRAELSHMSEHELRDLGIGRSQVPGLLADVRERHREYR